MVSNSLTLKEVLCRFKEYQDLAQLRFNFAGELCHPSHPQLRVTLDRVG